MIQTHPNWVGDNVKCNMRLLLKDVQHLVKDATDAMNTERNFLV